MKMKRNFFLISHRRQSHDWNHDPRSKKRECGRQTDRQTAPHPIPLLYQPISENDRLTYHSFKISSFFYLFSSCKIDFVRHIIFPKFSFSDEKSLHSKSKKSFSLMQNLKILLSFS